MASPPADQRLIVALDLPTGAEALRLANSLAGTCHWVKVGLELFVAAGPAMVDNLAAAGFSVFLDLKLHDIPNTVAAAVRAAGRSRVSMLTLHASGGPAMLAAAAAAARETNPGLQLLAVTVLTSMDESQLHAIGVPALPGDQVEALARMAVDQGIYGLVCSPQEIERLRSIFGPDVCLVTPGIRPAGADSGDQKRIATPATAIRDGADYLVVGRPITQSPDPRAAAENIQAEIAAALPQAASQTQKSPASSAGLSFLKL